MQGLFEGLHTLHSKYQLPDDELTAWIWYLRLFGEWTPTPIATPTLFLRAIEPLPGSEGADPAAWQTAWPLPHDLRDTPGNHLTMLTVHADAAARIVDEWLAGLAG
jgi:hypothetical protein